MALYEDDPIPLDISLSDAYAAIRDWYQNHPDPNGPWSEHPCEPNYARISISLIKSLPPPSKCSDVEKIAVLREILFGNLEWGFHQSDGKFKMGAYAVKYLSYSFTNNERTQLQDSVIWPHFSSCAKR